MAASMAVSAPLHVNEVVYSLHLFFDRALVLGVASAIPARPDRRGINVRNIFGEVAATNARQARGIELVSVVIELRHKRADRLLIFRRKFSRPIIFIAQSPE